MKSSVNKLMIAIWCFCMASFVFANDILELEQEYLQKGRETMSARMQSELNGIKSGDSRVISIELSDIQEYDYRALVVLEVSGGSYCDEREWGVGALDQFGCTSATYDLGSGTHEIWMGDVYGDGWNGGSLTVSVDGNVLATYDGPSSGCESELESWDSGDPCWAVESLNLSECSDDAACNSGSLGDCTYAPTNADCSGTCLDGFTADCNGDCGGSAVSDCTGTCGGTVLDTDFLCSSENIANGPAPSGATSGMLYDQGGLTGDYPTSTMDAYTIDVGTGVVQFDVTGLSLESCCDKLFICDLQGSPSGYPWNGSGQCQQITSAGVYTSDTSEATVHFRSDSSVTDEGFAISWSQGFLGCTDATACGGYDASATIDDGSCLSNDAIGVCGGSCAADADTDSVCDDVDDCVGSYDSCGLCNGADASHDCAGTCSGTLAAGTFTLDISYADGDSQNEVYTLSASGSNWSVSNCSNFDAEGSLETSVSFSADCDLTSDFWAGAVSLSLSVDDLASGNGSMALSGTGLSVSLAGSVDLANSTGNTLTGSTQAAAAGGALADNCGGCDFDTSNDCVQDCAGQWGGTAALDGCGLCNGGNTSQDCLGTCSGTLAQGTFSLDISYADGDTENEIYALTASGDNWSVANCSNFSASSAASISFSADCDLTTDFWVGSVSMSLGIADQTSGLGTITLSGSGLSVSIDGAVDFTNSQGSTLNGDLNETAVGGAVVDNCDVCDGDGSSCVVGCMDATACNYNPGAGVAGDCYTIDTCGQCTAAADSNANLDCSSSCFGNFTAGTFTLAPNTTGEDWDLTASADDSSWSLGDCSNYDGSGAPENNLAFTADCVLTSATYTGSVALTLTLSDVADDGSATGSVSLASTNFNVTASGSVADSSTFPTLNGALSSFDVAAQSDLDSDGLCDSVDPDADNDGLEPTTDGVTGDCDDLDATVGLCTYASCDEWGGTGCLWADGTVYEWSEGWWQCEPWNGNDVCGLAEVNFEVDTNGSADAAGNTLVGMFGPYNGWNPNFDIYSDADGDGVHTLTLYLGVGDLEYKLFGNADASAQEDLLDFGTTAQGENEWGPYYEYLNASCATVTDYYSYANRMLSITAADINTSQTVSTCYGSCNDTCLTGCTDATSCNYTADDALNTDLSGQVNYDSDDGSCLQTDTCGFCGGLDVNLDCAGDCSGDLAAGSLTEDAGASLAGAADDDSWTLGGCTVVTSTITDNSFLQTVSTDYACEFTSNVFVGSVTVSTEQNVIANTNTPTTALFSVVVDGGSHFGFTTAAVISSFGDDGIVGNLTFSDTFGLVGTGVDGKGTDCNQECGGTAAVDTCGVCAGGNTAEVADEDNLGCGCFNDAALAYFVDADTDGLGENGSDSVLYCLTADDCANVDGGCSSATLPTVFVPGTPDTCADVANWSDSGGDTCADYVPYWCGATWQGSYADANGLTGDDACCGCGGGDITSGVADSYVPTWVLNDNDADDACTSNVHDCNDVCDGPGSPATASGDCCNTGQIDCAGECDSAIYGTGVDGLGTDCNNVCGGPAQLLGFGWTAGSYDYETSWSILDSNGQELASDADGLGYPGYTMPTNACFLADETYEVSLCDDYGDSWNGAALTIGDESYYGAYGYMAADECLVSSFSLSGDGGCNVDVATNYSVDSDWDNGSCLHVATAPSGLTVSAEDSPADYPGDIGFRISWDTVPYAERYVLAWYDSSEAPELGDDCDYYYGGGGGTIDCNGSCNPSSWLGSGSCSSSFNCVENDWDGEDCCVLNGLMQTDDSTALCYDAPALTCTAPDVLVAMNVGSCCSGEHSFQILDNADDSVVASGSGDAYEACHVLPASWRVELSDSYGDGWDGATLTIGDTTYGSSFTGGNLDCTNNDGTDCSPAAPVPGDACTYLCYDWSTGYYDCASEVNCFGSCADPYYLNWQGASDGCDSMWNCAEHSYDYGDCGVMSAGDDVMPESKVEMLEQRISTLEPQSTEWYKLLSMIPTFENPMIHGSLNSDYTKDTSDELNGYSVVTDYQIKVATGNNPNSNQYRAALGFNVWKEADGTWTNIGSTTDGTTFQVTTDPIGCYAVSAYDTDPVYETALSSSDCLAAPACPITGDVTQDGLINVSDIVYLVNSILGSGLDAGCADMNGDGSINVSDVVALVNVILNPRTASANDASEAVLLISENSLKLESDGFVQGIQMTLSHDFGFEIELTDAYISEYKTMDNQTTLMIVTDGSHSIDEIATFSGDVIIESVHVVNQSGDVTVEETVEIASFEVKVTGPNPFNPSTQLNIVVPEAGFVSVNVYNILGQKVATLVDGYMDASSAGHMVNFNASHLASGVYLVRAVTANDVATQKLMLLK